MNQDTKVLEAMTNEAGANVRSITNRHGASAPFLLATISFDEDSALGGVTTVYVYGANQGQNPEELAAITDLSTNFVYDAQTHGPWEDVYLELDGNEDGDTDIIPIVTVV